MNIYFDVDHTLISSDNRLRPGVRELFEHLVADGHAIYLWSGIGERPEVVEAYGLGTLVSGCHIKPLYQHRRMLEPLGITAYPEFVVDDHPHLVAIFGGVTVTSFLRYDPSDREMERVYDAVRARAG